MRGEELQSLNVQQLQALEKSLESGLGSVLKTKVRVRDNINLSSDGLGFAHLDDDFRIAEPKDRSYLQGQMPVVVCRAVSVLLIRVSCSTYYA